VTYFHELFLGGDDMPQAMRAALTILGLITVWTGVLLYVV